MVRDLADDSTILEALKQDVLEGIAESREAEENFCMYEPWGGVFSKNKTLPRPEVFVLKTPGSAPL